MILRILFCLIFLAASVSAQTITVSNYLNPDGLPAREALTAITGADFTDSYADGIFSQSDEVNGVRVWIDGVPQKIYFVQPDQVVFILNRRGGGNLRVQTKSGEEFTTRFLAADAWPGVFITGAAADKPNYIPLALYNVDGIHVWPVTSEPIPVGPKDHPTIVLVVGSGWRNAARSVGVRLNGIPCRVKWAGPSFFPGNDVVAFEIPHYLAGNGAMDLTVFIGSRASNFARLYLQ